MWPALIIRSPSLKFLLLSLVLAQRQISSLLNIIFPYKSFSHLCCNIKIPRLATPCCIFRDVTRIFYILCSFPILAQTFLFGKNTSNLLKNTIFSCTASFEKLAENLWFSMPTFEYSFEKFRINLSISENRVRI